MKSLLILLGEGGHTEQMLSLVDKLGDNYNYEYVIQTDDKISEARIRKTGKVFKLYNPRSKKDKGLIKVFFKYFWSSIQAISLLAKSKSKFIIASGPASSVHICILGKIFFRKKIIFLESWSRVYTKSMSGKFVYPFADLFFVQWPEEKKNYPKAIYAGRLG